MKFIAIETEIPGAPEEQIQPFLKAESKRVLELYENGIIREIYFKAEQHNAVLILECIDKTDAENILHTLPLVNEKLIAFDVSQLIPYNGFSKLIS